MTVTIRSREPGDYEAMQRILASPAVVWGTLQLPFPSVEMWRQRLAEPSEGLFSLVACVEQEVVGHVDLVTFPHKPRRRHVGQIGGISVREDRQGQE